MDSLASSLEASNNNNSAYRYAGTIVTKSEDLNVKESAISTQVLLLKECEM